MKLFRYNVKNKKLGDCVKIIYILVVLSLFIQAKDYTKKGEVIRFINKMAKETSYTKTELKRLFSNVRVQKTALRAFIPLKKQKRRKETRTAKQIKKARHLRKTLGPWERYARLKTNPSRVRQGTNFIRKHQKVFDAVEKKYGVPKEYIAAIIGVETVYGGHVGKYPVFDTLVTLAFEKNRRNRFFKKELSAYLKLAKSEKFNPKNVRGSYAAAIGLGQFLPSNYRAYGVDFNKDGRITMQSAPDAIASIANYFKKNGWRRGEPVAVRVRYEGKRFNRYKTGYRHKYSRASLGSIKPIYAWDYKGKVSLIKLKKKAYDELWYGAKNFFVITRYNHSDYYAMAIHQLAQKIKKRL